MSSRSLIFPPIVRQALIALLTGAISGAITALIMGGVGIVTKTLWGDPTEQGLDYTIPLAWSLGVCGGFGALLALIHRGGEKTLLPELPETLQDLNHPEDAPPRDNLKAIAGAIVALVGGGVSGPEALMTRIAALSSQRIWRGRDQDLQNASVAGTLGLFGAPLLGGAVVGEQHGDLIRRWIPGTIGGMGGFVLFHGIDEVTGGSLRAMPYMWPSNPGEDIGTLGSAIIAGLIGSALGLLLRSWRGTLQRRRLLAHWRWWPVITGLLLGAMMHWLPLVPFAGEEQLRPLLEGVNRSQVAILMLSGLIKLLMLGLCLETGWRGGIFFPVFLIACAFGSALNQLFPEVGTLGSWCGGVTAAFYMVMLRARISVLVLSVVLLQGHGATGALVGVVVGEMISRFVPLGGAPQPDPETPDSP